MAFVTLTTMPEDGTQIFVDRFAVPWPCGYGAKETIGRFGAYKIHNIQWGYETKPTLFLVDARGVVRWCDNQGRTLHGDPAAYVRNLEEQIEQILAADDNKPATP